MGTNSRSSRLAESESWLIHPRGNASVLLDARCLSAGPSAHTRLLPISLNPSQLVCRQSRRVGGLGHGIGRGEKRSSGGCIVSLFISLYQPKGPGDGLRVTNHPGSITRRGGRKETTGLSVGS